MKTEKIKSKGAEFIKLRNELIGAADFRNPPLSIKECPLLKNHSELSKSLFGVGHFQWSCGLCGKTFVE